MKILKRITILAIFCVPALLAHCQNKLYIYEIGDISHSYELSEIDKLTFTQDEMLLTPLIGNASPFVINDISYMSFKPADSGIAQNQQEEISVYPNPVSDVLTIKSSGGMQKISIVDISGKLCLQMLPKTDIIDINMSRLPAGIYFVSVQNDDKVNVSKIVKNQ